MTSLTSKVGGAWYVWQNCWCISILNRLYAGHTELWDSLFWDSILLHAYWWRKSIHTRTKSNLQMMVNNSPQQPSVALQILLIGQWSRMSISLCGCLQAWFQLLDITYLTFIYQASIYIYIYIYEEIAPNDMHTNVIYIAYATDQGLSSHDATVIMAVLSTSSFVGRVFIGWVVIIFSQWHMLIITTGTWVIALDVLIHTCYACLWAHLAACCCGCLLVLMARSWCLQSSLDLSAAHITLFVSTLCKIRRHMIIVNAVSTCFYVASLYLL